MPKLRTFRIHRSIWCGGVVSVALLAGACEKAPQPTASGPTAAGGEFEGTWNARGSRRTMALGDERRTSTIDLRGSMLLSGAGRPAVGFRAEVIGLSDTATGLVGRAVWTDEQGEQVFSELKGEGTKENNRVVGTIIGGTGRHRGVTGSYEFAWEFVIESDDGSIQGRAVGLKGRYSLAGARP